MDIARRDGFVDLPLSVLVQIEVNTPTLHTRLIRISLAVCIKIDEFCSGNLASVNVHDESRRGGPAARQSARGRSFSSRDGDSGRSGKTRVGVNSHEATADQGVDA